MVEDLIDFKIFDYEIKEYDPFLTEKGFKIRMKGSHDIYPVVGLHVLIIEAEIDVHLNKPYQKSFKEYN